MECEKCNTEMSLVGFEENYPKKPRYVCGECGKQEINTTKAWVAWFTPPVMIRLDSTHRVNEKVVTLACKLLGPIHIQGGNYKEMIRLESVIKFSTKFSTMGFL